MQRHLPLFIELLPFSGYNEIQNPKRKYVLNEMLKQWLSIDSYDLLKEYRKGWVEEYLDIVQQNL